MSYFQSTKKAKTISLQVFNIMDFNRDYQKYTETLTLAKHFKAYHGVTSYKEKFKSGNRFSFISFVPTIYGICYRSVVLHQQHGIDFCKNLHLSL